MEKALKKAYELDLHLFDAGPVQTTQLNVPGNDLSPEMKTYYDKLLIANAEPALVHDQFAQKRNIPKGGGKTIEFRRFTPLKKQMRTLEEGVTPVGNKLDVTKLEATVDQYGDFIVGSDLLELTAIDNIGVETTEELGSQAGRTLDTVTREVIAGGTQVIYAPALIDGDEIETLNREEITGDCRLTIDLIYRAVRQLKKMNAPKVDAENYVAIINQDVAYDIMAKDPTWRDVHKYAATAEIFNGEIGRISGCRFVETTEAKTIGPEPICGFLPTRMGLRTALDGTGSTSIMVDTAIDAADATKIAAAISGGAVYEVYVGGVRRTVTGVTAGAPGTARLTVNTAVTNKAIGSVICGTGAGADGSAVYSVVVLGKNAYGTTTVEGGGLEHIFKPKGSAGTADPLNQRWSMGWKALKVAERLVEDNMVRIECGSTFSETVESN